MIFELNPRLSQDTLFITNLKLSQLLLMNDKRFPWLILVPRKVEISEIYELSDTDQTTLFSEIVAISQLLKTLQKSDKLNIAALGNVVPQLHIHIIARHKQDVAWPAPVWNFQQPVPYPATDSQTFIERIKLAIPASIGEV